MYSHDNDDLLKAAGSLLRDCVRDLDHGASTADLADAAAAIRYLYAAAKDRATDWRGGVPAGTKATAAIGLAVLAAAMLRACVNEDLQSGWLDDEDGPPFGGLEEDDEDEISRPLAVDAVEAARIAMSQEPDDPLAPVLLGRALMWLGDREGAVTALEEALRRDPWDSDARLHLAGLGAAPSPEPASDGLPVSSRAYGFVLLRLHCRISNGDWGDWSWLLGSVAEARAVMDSIVGDVWEGAELDEVFEHDTATMEIHVPGEPVWRRELFSRVVKSPDGPFTLDWSRISFPEQLGPPLPPGRPVRIGGRNHFYGFNPSDTD